jgi:hypothetical protein
MKTKNSQTVLMGSDMDNGTGLTRLSIIKTANMKCKKNKVK